MEGVMGYDGRGNLRENREDSPARHHPKRSVDGFGSDVACRVAILSAHLRHNTKRAVAQY